MSSPISLQKDNFINNEYEMTINKSFDNESNNSNEISTQNDNPMNNNNINNNINNEDDLNCNYSLPDKYNIKFLNLCKLFEALSRVKPKEKLQLFNKFLSKCFSSAITSNISLYNFFRLVFPKLDRLRSVYGVQEVFLGKLYSDILSLPDEEKLMLKHWKNPSFLPSPAPVGDFVNLVRYIISSRVTQNAKLTINEVNDLLTDLSTSNNKEERSLVMTKIIKNCTAQEQKWIISIILKDLKIGFNHESFFKYYDPRTLDIYNSTMSLVEVCNYISNPKSEKYINTYYQLFAPIKPMLVARMTLDNILTTFNGVNVFVETKWDGERIQCHLNNKQVKFFSRKGIDYTYLYGPKLSHLIISCINAQSAIVDGEVVVWDKREQKFAAFGENKTVALSNDEIDKVIVYEIFDIIFLASPKGEAYPLNSVILSDRKKIMNKVITPVPKKIEVVLGKETNSVDTIMSEFSNAIERGEEGIVIKKTDSIYKPDERCSDWVKMKCDYIDTIVDTLDLIILGGYYGEGRRVVNIISNNSIVNSVNIGSNDYSDNISTFLLGVIKQMNKESPRNSTILPIVKIGSGYSMRDLNLIREKLRNKWRKYDSRVPPSLFGQWTPEYKERPDVFIEDPSESVILEVKAAEIVPTETFPSKVTLRFPRVVQCRFDKSWDDTLKYNELLQYYNTSTVNLNANNTLYSTGNTMGHNYIIKRGKRKQILNTLDEHGGAIDDNGDNDMENKKNKKIDKYSKILENFRDTDTSNITKISNLFSGFQFLVLSLDDVIAQNSIKKKMLEYAIVEHGGEKVQNYLPNSTTHVIAEKVDVKIKNIIELHSINIINSKWVYDCIKFKRIIPLSPMYLTYINKETKDNFKLNIDQYNDSYYEDIDMNELKEIFTGMKGVDINKLYNKALKEIKNEFDFDESLLI